MREHAVEALARIVGVCIVIGVCCAGGVALGYVFGHSALTSLLDGDPGMRFIGIGGMALIGAVLAVPTALIAESLILDRPRTGLFFSALVSAQAGGIIACGGAYLLYQRGLTVEQAYPLIVACFAVVFAVTLQLCLVMLRLMKGQHPRRARNASRASC